MSVHRLVVAMRLRSAISAALFAVLAPVTAYGADVSVFHMIGASNMEGTALISSLPASWRQTQEGVWIWKDTPDLPGEWTSLSPGFGQLDSNFGSAGDSQYFGPELSLGRALAAAMPDQQIALIKHSRGGSDVQIDWNPNGPADNLWNNWSKKTDDALARLSSLGFSYENVGMFMYQGARDARNLTGVEAAAYETNLSRFVTAARVRLADPELAIVMAHLPFFYPGDIYVEADFIREVQARIAAADPLVGLINVDDLPVRDDVHFTADGLLQLGSRYADEYLGIAAPEPDALMLTLCVVPVLIGIRGVPMSTARSDSSPTSLPRSGK